MRSALLLFTVTILFALPGFCQDSSTFGKDNKPQLTLDESKYFDSLFVHQKGSFEFKGKKVGFIDGQDKPEIISKNKFFIYYVLPYSLKGVRPPLFLILLTEDEQNKSGGYTALITTYITSLNEKKKKKTFQQLKESN